MSTAVPPASDAVPMVLAPSRKVTVPTRELGDTVAVSVTKEPYVEGLGDDVSVTDVATCREELLDAALDVAMLLEDDVLLLCSACCSMSSVTSMGVGIP